MRKIKKPTPRLTVWIQKVPYLQIVSACISVIENQYFLLYASSGLLVKKWMKLATQVHEYKFQDPSCEALAINYHI